VPRQINFSVDDRVYSKLEKMAAEKSMATSRYAAVLFEAAYAARCGFAQGDVELEAAVARSVLLGAAGSDTATIAKAVGLSEATVDRIRHAWRDEIRARAA
jgi:hypothetical protein